MPLPMRDRFSMPPEWALHESTWLAWPRAAETWVAGVDEAEEAYLRMVRILHESERVELLAPPDEAETVEERLRGAGIDALVVGEDPSKSAKERGLVRVHPFEYVDSWLRDTAPTVVTGPEGEQVGIDWRFDAWGGKYDALERDDDVARGVAKLAGIETLSVDLVMEGGAIDVDGNGRLLATESSLLHPNRGERSKRSLETLFSLLLGADEVLWLKGGFQADDTDGHVDTVARFVGPGRVLAVEPPGKDHPDHANLAENLARLTSYRAEGLLEEVTSLPFAGDIEHEGDPLPASYANFYVANEAVLVPAFEVPRDEIALAIVEEAFPKRKVVPVPSEPLIVGYGSCHCLTQQIPAP